MSSDARIDELLQCWEEQRNQDKSPSPEELCADCPELVDEVRRRLQALRAMDEALDLSEGLGEPTVADSDGLGEPVLPLPAPAVSAAVEVRYRPLRFHARGGLGEVYLAEDEELHREVALKRIQSPHAQHAASRRRFIREAEITSRLEHPGIVPIYGLGQDAQGRPVYAMRFIQGETLQDAIERFHAADRKGHSLGERGLALRQLLGRFLAVCNAISYAHSRGVLHRDLKPANVMLGKFGETLVVDWGLAKTGFEKEDSPVRSASEEAKLTPRPIAADETEPTQLGRAMGTPSYMSPEQAAGRWDVVGPASDIYSLGATLYCILTGQPPVRGSSVPEVLALTQHGEVTRPRTVNPSVPAALEAVCLTAMARQSEDRYPTVQALAADVEAWLADEPVTAYREPWTARLGRWARRHRPLVVGAAVLLLAAVAALAVLAWQSEQGRQRLQNEQGQTEAARLLAVQRAEEARTNALQAAENERQARLFETEGRQAFAKYFIAVSEDPELMAAPLEPLRKQLLEHAREYYQKFANERGQDSTLRAELADAVFRLGFITSEIGDKQQAIDHYKQAVSLWGELHQKQLADTSHARELARSQTHLGAMYRDTAQFREAEIELGSALALMKKLHEAPSPALPLTRNLAMTHHNLGLLYQKMGRWKEAETAYGEAAALRQKLYDQQPSVGRYASDLAGTHHNLGQLHRESKRPQEAEKSYQKALGLWKDLHQHHAGTTSYANDLALCHSNLGVLYREQERPDEAEAAFQSAFVLQDKLHREHRTVTQFASNLASTYTSLGHLHRARNRPENAKTAYENALPLRRKLHADHPRVADYAVGLGTTLNGLGNLVLDRGTPEAALPYFAEAIAAVEKVLQDDQRHADARAFLVISRTRQAHTLSQLKRHAEAVESWDQALKVDDGRYQINLRVQRALSLARAGEPASALRQAEEVLKDKEKVVPAERLYDLARVHALCFSLTNNEDHAASAVALLKRAVERGYKNAAQLKDNRDLDALRAREDFKDVLRRMERTK